MIHFIFIIDEFSPAASPSLLAFPEFGGDLSNYLKSGGYENAHGSGSARRGPRRRRRAKDRPCGGAVTLSKEEREKRAARILSSGRDCRARGNWLCWGMYKDELSNPYACKSYSDDEHLRAVFSDTISTIFKMSL